MKLFNSKEDYNQFIKNWKMLANASTFKNKPHMFVIYNILKDRDPLYGFSDNTKCHVLFLMNNEISREMALCGYNDKRSIILKLLQDVSLDNNTFMEELKAVNRTIVKKARDMHNNSMYVV